MSNDKYLSRREFLRVGVVSTAAVAVSAVALPALALDVSAPQGRLALSPKPHPLARAYSPDILIGWVEAIYDLVRQERFSPTSAARAYGYVAIAAYEAIVTGMPGYRSLGGQLNGLSVLTVPARSLRVHWPISLNAAVETAALAVFADRSETSRSEISDYAATLRADLATGVPGEIAAVSDAYGRAIGDHIANWAKGDGYAQILGLPYNPPVGPGLWERTPPNFGAALEPHWGRVRPMALPTADACAPPPPVPFSTVTGSAFWEQAMTVYEVSQEIGDQERATALFWRDNPDGTTGLPSGHWMLIGNIAVKDRGLHLGAAAEVLALLGISLADGFTSCWTEKYRSNVLRPVTYIRNHIDAEWASFVNSPAFPEYTSGHSVGSAAAATTLTALLGETPFVDDSGGPYGRETRTFASFQEAADEAAVSRLYGGIHYPMAIEVGLDQGIHVSQVVRDRVRTRVGGR